MFLLFRTVSFSPNSLFLYFIFVYLSLSWIRVSSLFNLFSISLSDVVYTKSLFSLFLLLMCLQLYLLLSFCLALFFVMYLCTLIMYLFLSRNCCWCNISNCFGLIFYYSFILPYSIICTHTVGIGYEWAIRVVNRRSNWSIGIMIFVCCVTVVV